jgi:hypothetical protein
VLFFAFPTLSLSRQSVYLRRLYPIPRLLSSIFQCPNIAFLFLGIGNRSVRENLLFRFSVGFLPKFMSQNPNLIFTMSQSKALFAWLISHQPTVLFSHNKPATSNQPESASSTLLSEQTSTSHQPPANRTG